jgi:hypothetical protein
VTIATGPSDPRAISRRDAARSMYRSSVMPYDRFVSVLVTSALFVGACLPATEMPAPPSPAKQMPDVGDGLDRASPGKQWVVLDTPGDKARVTRLAGMPRVTVAEGDVYEGDVVDTACASTPCAVALRVGPHKLNFISLTEPGQKDSLTIDVPDQPIVVRHVIERYDDTTMSSTGKALGVIGLIATLGSGALIPIGATQDFGDQKATLFDLGLVSLGVGVVGLVVAAVFIHDRKHTPGATTEWRFDLPAASATGH